HAAAAQRIRAGASAVHADLHRGAAGGGKRVGPAALRVRAAPADADVHEVADHRVGGLVEGEGGGGVGGIEAQLVDAVGVGVVAVEVDGFGDAAADDGVVGGEGDAVGPAAALDGVPVGRD